MAQSATAAVPGTIEFDLKKIRLQRIAVLFLTLGPLAGFLAAILVLWSNGLTGTDLLVMGTMYAISTFGVTVGYHRLFTHKSFEAPKAVRAALAVGGSMAIQGAVIDWVADHRRHHAYSDQVGDPHSPHLAEGEGFSAMFRGLWHAHIGWLFRKDGTENERWAPDMLKDPILVRVNKMFPLLAIASFVLPAAMGLALTQSWWGAFTALLWGGAARLFLVHHMTWSINSICHFFGKREYDTPDESTNNWPLALLSFGESWHNNHHAFPSSAIHGLKPWQIDLSAAFIVTLEKLGLARNVKRVTEKQLASKLA